MNIFDFNSNISLFKQRQDENELAHYGTRGQKWGVRKWQNYDGTFNEAGKIRYFGKKSSDSSEKMGSLISISRKINKSFNKGHIANHNRNTLINDIIKNRKDYDAVNLNEDEIKEIASRIDFNLGDKDFSNWQHDARQQFKRESLKLQLEKALGTKFGTARNPKMNLKVDPELLKEYSEDEIEDSIQNVINDIRSRAPEGPDNDPSSYDVNVNKDGSFHIDFHYDDEPKELSPKKQKALQKEMKKTVKSLNKKDINIDDSDVEDINKFNKTVKNLNDNYEKHNEIIIDKLADMYYNAYKNTYGYEENPLSKTEFKKTFENIRGTLHSDGILEGYTESGVNDSFSNGYYFNYDVLNKIVSDIESD